MSPPIDIDGSEIQEATIDGQDVNEITIDGQQAADLNVIPDTSMFQSPLYQYTAVAGLSASDGQTANNWTEQLAGAGDATAVNTPAFRADQGDFAAVEYNGSDEAHDFPSDGQLPTGGDPVSFAATVWVKSVQSNVICGYGTDATSQSAEIGCRDFDQRVVVESFGDMFAQSTAQYPTGQWITVGGAVSDADGAKALLNGGNKGTDTGSLNRTDQNRGIGYRSYGDTKHSDIYLYDLVICSAFESDQAFSDYHQGRLG